MILEILQGNASEEQDVSKIDEAAHRRARIVVELLPMIEAPLSLTTSLAACMRLSSWHELSLRKVLVA